MLRCLESLPGRTSNEGPGRADQDDTHRGIARRFADLFIRSVAGEDARAVYWALLSPVTAAIPAGAQFRQVFAILIVLVVCVVAGLVVRTGAGLRAKNAFERLVLEKIPGYVVVRGLAERLSGDPSEGAFRPALVELEDALAPGFIIEELEDGRYTVLVPSVPTPAAGALQRPAAGARAPRGRAVHAGGEGHLQVGRGRGDDGPRRVGRFVGRAAVSHRSGQGPAGKSRMLQPAELKSTEKLAWSVGRGARRVGLVPGLRRGRPADGADDDCEGRQPRADPLRLPQAALLRSAREPC